MGIPRPAPLVLLALLAACSRDGGVPPDLPRQVRGNWGPRGDECPRLVEGTFALPLSDGSAFLAGVDTLPPPRYGAWEALRVERRADNHYTLVRAMGRERFLEAAGSLRAAEPDVYARWRAAGLRRGFERMGDEAAAAGLTPAAAVDAQALGCKEGWVTLTRTSRWVENTQGLKQSEFLQVDVTPDVQGGMLVRTTRCRMETTQVLSTKVCTMPVTAYGRLAPAPWPSLGVIGAADLPPPAGGPQTRAPDGAAGSGEPSAATGPAPPPAVRALATAIFERLPGRLPAGVTLESITARESEVDVTLHTAVPGRIKEVVSALREDPDVAGVTIADMRTTPDGATLVRLALRPHDR